MKIGLMLFGLAIMAFAVGVFYQLFFKFAPSIAALIPPSEWSPLLKIGIYALIGYVGGVAVPVVIFVFGAVTFVKGL